MLAKGIATPKETVNLDLIDYYYDWWRQFTNLPLQKIYTEDIIRREINRNTNIGIRTKMGGSESIPLEITPDAYAIHLLRMDKSVVDVREIFKEDNV